MIGVMPIRNTCITKKPYHQRRRSKKNCGEIYQKGGLVPDVLPEINRFNNNPYSDKYKTEVHSSILKLPMNAPDTVTKLQNSFNNFQVTLLTAETGAGKSTLISLHLMTYLQKVYGLKSTIWITQPRRLAAINVAGGTARAMDVELGKQVGYRISGVQMMDDTTRVLFVTEAILFKEYVKNPDIPDINAVIIDEAHERGMDTDLILLFTKLAFISKRRPDLKIIIMSATANINLFLSYFPGSNLVQVGGIAFPVKDFNLLKNPKDYTTAAISEIVNICKRSKDGDILIFFPKKPDNTKGCMMLEEQRPKINGTFKCFVFSGETVKNEKEMNDITKMSAQAFEVDRKIIFSTNVAEASVTIDGIVYVIDSGKAQISGFDSSSGVSTLNPEWISKANARQRRGRCGRTQPGECHRLYTEKQHDRFEDFEKPEILRKDITEKLLEIFAMEKYSNANDLWHLTKLMITEPPMQAMRFTFEKFATLGIMDNYGNITKNGKRVAALQPLSVELGRAMMFANEYGCRVEMCELAAVIKTVPNLLKDLVIDSRQIDKRFRDPDGEIFTLLRIVRTARMFGKDSKELARFCVAYGLRQYSVEAIIEAFNQFRANFEGLYSLLNPTYYFLEEPLQIEVPYFKLYKDAVWQWQTSNVSGNIRDRIVRCLLHGYFMNCVSFRKDALRSIGRNLKVTGQITTKLAFYITLNRPQFGRDKYPVTALTEIKQPLWLIDAARHYLPLVKFKSG